jgi:hypothetical protein
MATQHIHIMPAATHIAGPRKCWLERQDMRNSFVLGLGLNLYATGAEMIGDFQIILMAGDL